MSLRPLATALLLLLATAPAHAIPSITRDKIIDIAKSGVGCRYVWGGTCWNPANKTWKGADCSGYVTKTWQIPDTSATTDCLPHYYTTSTFQNSTTHWTKISRDNLIKADALVYNNGSAGHIVLYESGDKWGTAKVYEARGTAYGIVHRDKTVESKYVARRRNNIAAPVPTYPLMTITSKVVTIEGQARDFCKDGDSAAIFDWRVGQSATVNIDVKNGGTAVAKNVKVGLWAEAPYLVIDKWNIYSDWKQDDFVLNDTDGMQSIAHDDPGQSFVLNLYGLGIGETKRIKLVVRAETFSVGQVDHPDVRAWIKNVDDYYTKQSFDSSFTNVKDYQKQNGGDLRAYSQTDVFGEEVCDEVDNDCNGQVDEGEVCQVEADAGPPPQTDAHVNPPWPDFGTKLQADDLQGGCAVARGSSRWSLLPALLLLCALGLVRRRRR